MEKWAHKILPVTGLGLCLMQNFFPPFIFQLWKKRIIMNDDWRLYPPPWKTKKTKYTSKTAKFSVAETELSSSTHDTPSKMASLTFLQPLSNLSSPTTLVSLKNPHHIPSFTSLNPSIIPKTRPVKSFTASFSLAESNSPKSLQPNLQPFLQELAVRNHFLFKFRTFASWFQCQNFHKFYMHSLVLCFQCQKCLNFSFSF